MAHGHELRIREVERRFELMDGDLRTLRRQVTAVREGVRDYWIDGTSTKRCITTIQGTIYGGRLVGFPGATIRFVGATTAADYGTATADGSGDFEHAMEIGSADSTLDVFTDYPTDGGRLDGAALIINFAPSLCVVSTGVEIGPSGTRGVEADTGYVYPVANTSQLAPSAFPLATTLDVTDSGNPGTFTVTWTGLVWSGTHGGLTYTFFWDQGNDWFGVNITPGALAVNVGTTWTDPDPATATKFSVTMTFFGIPGRTITFTEP